MKTKENNEKRIKRLKKHVTLSKKNPQICKSQEQYHRLAHLHINYVFLVSQKKGQLVPNMGKHRAKQELETVPPQELGTVPPQGSKKRPLRWYCF